MNKTQIMVIDDDPDLCELIEDALQEDYDIQSCSDPRQAETMVARSDPAIIIMDVNLPNSSGFQLCEKFNEEVPPPLVLFVSGDNSLEIRLQAYNHGGSDFLAKPFKIRELQAKVEALNQLHLRQIQFQTSSRYASQTAMNAMVEASAYGEVLRFYNDMYKADSAEKIKSCFFALMDNFGLHCSIQMRVEKVLSYTHTNETCSPIELQIFDNLNTSERIIPFSNRIMINGQYASIIVKNMPVDDEVNNGRLRDILATLIEGMDAKLLDLQRLGLLRQTSGELALSSQRLTKVMKDHEKYLSGAMNHVISEINASFHVLELTEKQEEFFTDLMEKVLLSMEESFVHIGRESDILDCIRLSLGAVLVERRK